MNVIIPAGIDIRTSPAQYDATADRLVAEAGNHYRTEGQRMHAKSIQRQMNAIWKKALTK